MTDKASFFKPDLPSGVHAGRDLLLPAGLSDNLLAGSLERVFGKDDDLEAVAVHLPSGPTYVVREDFLDTLQPELRSAGSFGDADQLWLAGREQLEPLKFDCPADGQRFEVFFLNPGEIRNCPRHPGVRLIAAVAG
jgi:hypothetical protein